MNPRHREAILPRFSLDRRITVLVLLATVLVVGTIATLGLPLELIPRGFEAPHLQVRGMWSNAPAQEMLDQVAVPLEEELSTVAGMQNLYTFATTGFTRVSLTFKSNTDMDVAYREVRDRIERAKVRMPEDVDRIEIRKADESAIPVYAFGITVDPDLADSYSLIQNEIVMPIKRVDGVAGISVQGLVEKEVLIELDRARTEAAGLNIFDLGTELAGDNFTMASGHVESGGKKLLLRSVAKYPDLDALRQRKLDNNVRLADVATIRYAEPEKRFKARANSKPAYFAIVLKESEANALEVSDRIEEAVTKMKSNPRLALIGIEVFFNQGKTILESLGILLDSGRIGALFAALVLFFFLRRVRMTVIIALSIPLSVFMGLVAMYFFGETLNIISLLGLMISVGLLVDNSVVVAENIFRLHQEGVPRREAAIRGAGEISLAIVMATLTTVIVFLPVSLVEGQGQFFLLRLSIPITVSLLASLFVALIFVPLAVYLTLPTAKDRTAKNSAAKPGTQRFRHFMRMLYDQSFERINHGYNHLLAFFLARRVDLVMAVTLVVLLTAAWPAQQIGGGMVQEDESGGIEIKVELPASTTMEEADEHFGRVEKIFEANKEAWDLNTYLIVHTRSSGDVQAWFNTPRSNKLTARELTEKLVATMPERAGAEVYTGLDDEDAQEKKNLQTYTLVGEDPDQLEKLAQEFEDLFIGVDGVLGIKQAADESADEMAIRVDRELAQRLGVSPQAVAGVVRNSIGGRSLPKFYRDGREIPVRVRYQEEDRESLAQLWDFRVPTAGGEAVSLASVTTSERLDSADRIWRTNKQVTRNITLELEEGREKETRKTLDKLVEGLGLPEGVRFGSPRRTSGAQSEVQAMLFAAGLSVVFIYLLMGFLFESFILPLSIVTTIPLAALGVVWGHFLTGIDIDSLGWVGAVLLIGVVVNNGIVLVDYVNRLREDGMERTEALLTSADRRFRPIMMTALTTICGMVPLVLGGTTSIGLSYKSFGITLIGGMVVATALTLLVVPVAYTFFDDLRVRFEGLMHRIFGPKPEPVLDEEAPDPAAAGG